MGSSALGKVLLLAGGLLALAGLLLLAGQKLPLLGRLPGDIRYEGRRVTIYLPLATCLVLSALLTLLVNLLARLLPRR